MKLKLRIVLLAICTISSGCAHQLTTIAPERKVYEVPEDLSTVVTAKIGDEIIAVREYEVLPAIELKQEVKAGGGIHITCTVPPQQLVAQLEDKDWVYYEGSNVTDYDSLLGSNNVMGGIKIRKQEKPGKNEAVFCRNNRISLYPIAGKIDYIPMVYRRPVDVGSRYSISYSGRNNDVLYFMFTHPNEFGETVESTIQHKMGESPRLMLGGSEIEIVSVEDALIRYRVLKRFNPPA